MSKEHVNKKNALKKPLKTQKEKKAEKNNKKNDATFNQLLKK